MEEPIPNDDRPLSETLGDAGERQGDRPSSASRDVLRFLVWMLIFTLTPIASLICGIYCCFGAIETGLSGLDARFWVGAIGGGGLVILTLSLMLKLIR